MLRYRNSRRLIVKPTQKIWSVGSFFGTITGMVDSRLHASKQRSFYGVFSGNRSIREKYLISSVDFSALYWLLQESWCLGGDSCICDCNVITTLGFTAVLCNSHRSMASKILLRLQFFDLWLSFFFFFFSLWKQSIIFHLLCTT